MGRRPPSRATSSTCVGPGGAYTPDPDADWHLLAGDASVIPAISASLPRIPPGTPVHVVIEVDGPDEEQPIETPGALTLTYLHRSAAPGEEPDLLAEAVAALELPGGRGHVFVHGEASSVRDVRRHLIADRGIDPATMSISGYWKLKRTEEGWREDKAEWARLVEADVAAAASSKIRPIRCQAALGLAARREQLSRQCARRLGRHPPGGARRAVGQRLRRRDARAVEPEPGRRQPRRRQLVPAAPRPDPRLPR